MCQEFLKENNLTNHRRRQEMKTGDRVKINIRPEKKDHFCEWLFNGAQHKKGTIVKEYPKDIISTDEFEFLIKFDNPPLQDDDRPFNHCWFNHKDLVQIPTESEA
jgi:hypothetical protein